MRLASDTIQLLVVLEEGKFSAGTYISICLERVAMSIYPMACSCVEELELDGRFNLFGQLTFILSVIHNVMHNSQYVVCTTALQ